MKIRFGPLMLLFYLSAWPQQNFEVFFDFNKDVPNEASTALLQNWMKEHREFVVMKISGYCDSVDNNAYNRELASRRINSVLKLLKDNEIHISPEVELNSFGEDFMLSKIQSENRKVAIVAEEIQKPPAAEIQLLSEQVRNAKPGDVIRLKNINFFNNSPQIVPKSRPVLFDLLCELEENPKLKIEIQGHICCKLEGDTNDISTARAKAVCVFLLRNGISRKRLSFKGYGISRPIYPIPEKNEQEEDENRRVEIRILEK